MLDDDPVLSLLDDPDYRDDVRNYYISGRVSGSSENIWRSLVDMTDELVWSIMIGYVSWD